MNFLLRHPATSVWLFLACATMLSWWIGTNHLPYPVASHTQISLILLMLTFVKVWLIIQYFMEARLAPWSLRLVCAAWVAFTCSTLIALYWTGASS